MNFFRKGRRPTLSLQLPSFVTCTERMERGKHVFRPSDRPKKKNRFFLTIVVTLLNSWKGGRMSGVKEFVFRYCYYDDETRDEISKPKAKFGVSN